MFMMLVMTAVVFGFSACSDDDDEVSELEKVKQMLVGSWGTEENGAYLTLFVFSNNGMGYLYFDEGAAFTYELQYGEKKGEYKLTMKFAGAESVKKSTISTLIIQHISKTEMYYQWEGGDDIFYLKKKTTK